MVSPEDSSEDPSDGPTARDLDDEGEGAMSLPGDPKTIYLVGLFLLALLTVWRRDRDDRERRRISGRSTDLCCFDQLSVGQAREISARVKPCRVCCTLKSP